MAVPYYPLFRYKFCFHGKRYCDWELSILCNRKGEIRQCFSVITGAFDLETLKFKLNSGKVTSEFLEKINEVLREMK